MGGSISGDGRVGHGGSFRQFELEQIKAQAEAKAAQYHAVAVQLEAQLQQEKRAATQSAAPKRKAKTSPPPVPKKAAAFRIRPVDEKEEAQRDRLAVFWDDVSSWLTSAVVHLVIIVLLGIFTLNMADELPTMELTATIDTTDAAELEELQAFEVKLEDPGLAKLDETTSTLEHLADAGQLDLAAMQGEIGAPFGKDGEGWASVGTGTGGATFFGIKSAGYRFVFVVDASTSMKRNGWKACQRELIAAVGRLKSYQSFYVILFNREPHRMFSDDEPEPDFVEATPESIERLRRWVYRFPLASGTYPKSSMRFALSLDPDSIYLLTDGRFHDDTEEFLKEHNQRKDRYDEDVPKVSVQTIGFYTDASREVLRRIARDNRGTFRYVARPPNDPHKPRGRRARSRR